MTDRELFEKALETLEEVADEVFSPYDNKLGETIIALRERLARDDLNKLAETDREIGLWPAQPEQESPGWLVSDSEGNDDFVNNETALEGRHYQGGEPLRLYTTPQPAQQPLIEISESLRSHGLTLVKTATGYDVIKLGQITAHDIKEQS